MRLSKTALTLAALSLSLCVPPLHAQDPPAPAPSPKVQPIPPPPPRPTITVVPNPGRTIDVERAIVLNGVEFEMVVLENYTGVVTWDVVAPAGGVPPVKTFELTPEQIVLGLRVNTKLVDAYVAPKTPSIAVYARGQGNATLTAWGVVDGKPIQLARREVKANSEAVPIPPIPPKPVDPPVPPMPVDPPVPPEPVPVTSFRVIFVLESGQTITAQQNSVIYAKEVSDYLNAKTTKDGTQPGWRRWDRDANVEYESETMKSLWAAVKPKITKTPCVSVEVNGKVEIIDLAATPTAMVDVFKKYRGE